MSPLLETGWVVSASADNLNGLVDENGLLVPSITGGGVNSCVIMKLGTEKKRQVTRKNNKNGKNKTAKLGYRFYRIKKWQAKKKKGKKAESVALQGEKLYL